MPRRMISASIFCLVLAAGACAQDWPMYQGNKEHNGYVPVTLTPQNFEFKWQRILPGLNPLNPVVANDTRVYVTEGGSSSWASRSLFALDAETGDTIWQRVFHDVHSVNPPSIAYGNVYLQIGRHSPGSTLRAFDAETGAPIFASPFVNQWRRFYAPTVDNGTVYINGGYAGGMYAFDAFTGTELWYRSLPQFDLWAPTLRGNIAFAYVGERLYALDRASGALLYMIHDLGAAHTPWSMDFSVVVGTGGNILAAQGDRLLCFDTDTQMLRWEVGDQFRGQVSFAHGKVFANNNGALAVHDEATGTALWSWHVPAGTGLIGTMIVTDNLVLARNALHTFAIDLHLREMIWSIPISGHLALAHDTIYIAGNSGVLTAISTTACYANCDRSLLPPILNASDFTCFINEFSQAQMLPYAQQVGHYANCDGSTTIPVLDVNDFMCFIDAFSRGCD